MREVGAFEAKNKLGQLLDLVEQGEEITITRHGKEVARLVPVRSIRSREEARAALQRIRQRALLAVLIAGGRSWQSTHSAEATKATQRARIVSIGPRHDRYGFNS